MKNNGVGPGAGPDNQAILGGAQSPEGMPLSLKPCLETDFDFAFAAKKDALGPVIVERWGWDEAFQRQVHRERWEEKPWSLVMLGDNPIGTVSIQSMEADLDRFGEFYLVAPHRGRGIGSRILEHYLKHCDQVGKRVRLEVLKWNRAGSLYRRYGFDTVGENEIHDFLEREPGVRRSAPKEENHA